MPSNSILSRIVISTKQDERGILSICEFPEEKLFPIKRLYYIFGVPRNESRGMHAHKSLRQIFLAVSGSFTLEVTDGEKVESVEITSGRSGYLLPNGYWRELKNFSEDAMCLVLASEHYDPSDYIHNKNEYLEWRKINAKY
jgi:dTDP-4-dehydrorhamnose 3,5-epimerase-like enzyme